MGSPFTSEEISDFNYDLKHRQMNQYISFHKYVLIIYIIIVIMFITYSLNN